MQSRTGLITISNLSHMELKRPQVAGQAALQPTWRRDRSARPRSVLYTAGPIPRSAISPRHTWRQSAAQKAAPNYNLSPLSGGWAAPGRRGHRGRWPAAPLRLPPARPTPSAPGRCWAWCLWTRACWPPATSCWASWPRCAGAQRSLRAAGRAAFLSGLLCRLGKRRPPRHLPGPSPPSFLPLPDRHGSSVPCHCPVQEGEEARGGGGCAHRSGHQRAQRRAGHSRLRAAGRHAREQRPDTCGPAGQAAAPVGTVLRAGQRGCHGEGSWRLQFPCSRSGWGTAPCGHKSTLCIIAMPAHDEHPLPPTPSR